MNKYTKTWKDLNKKESWLERQAPEWTFYAVFIGFLITAYLIIKL